MSSNNGDEYLTEHVYDGIRESNFPLPRWWLMSLWVTVFFGMGYWFYYESTGVGPTSQEEFTILMEAHQASVQVAATSNGTDKVITYQSLQTDMSDKEKLAIGSDVYRSNCAACHGPLGQGMIGPNLTDSQWIHDPAIENLHKIISEGILEKGMPAWGTMLGPKKVRYVLGFLTTMFDKNIEGKAPQGTEQR
jgi:cytochrome c oxidase cbb3-type subunit III